MAKFLQSLKYIISGKEEHGISAPQKQKIDITPELQLFIQQQAKRMKEHIDYEDDLSENLPRDSSLIIKFDLDSYIREFDAFFQTKELYSTNQEELFKLTLQILVPPEKSSGSLSKEFRKKIYAGMLKNICQYKSLPVQGLTKEYYDKINRLETFNGVAKNTILELYKESVELLGKALDQPETEESKETSFELDTASILGQVVRGFSVRNRQDMENLLYRNQFWGVLFTSFLLIVAAFLLLYFNRGILSGILGIDTSPATITFYSSCVIGLIVFFLMVRIVSYSKARLRRKLFLAAINTLISELKINYGEVKTLFGEQFKFDIRKTRKIKRIEKKAE